MDSGSVLSDDGSGFKIEVMDIRDSDEVAAAIAVLEAAGYYIGNLWHTEDVTNGYECQEYEAQEVLSEAVGGELIMEEINNRIDRIAREQGFTKKEKNDE